MQAIANLFPLCILAQHYILYILFTIYIMSLITMLLYVIATCLCVSIYHLKLCPRSLDLNAMVFLALLEGYKWGSM